MELKLEQERMIQEQLASDYERHSNRTVAERLIDFSRTHSVKLLAGETVEALIRQVRLSQ